MSSDVYYNILLNSSLDILKNLCLVNPNAIQHCNNTHFWIDKFNQDRLPLLISPYPTTLSGWIAEYEKVTQIKHIAADILLINEIEMTRDIDQLDGIISVTIFDKYVNVLPNILPSELSDLYLKDYPASLEFQLLPQGNYVIILDQELITAAKINSDYNEVLNTLTKFLYYDPDIKIIDDQGRYFKIPPNIEIYYDDSKRILYKRLAIWDTIKFLKI